MEELKEDNILKLYIDNRETYLKNHFKEKSNVVFGNLDLGDILIKKGDETVLIMERKTIQDLSASIIDGRHKEQKTRLMGSGIKSERIVYLIEGDIVKTKTTVKGGVNTLVGSLINTQLRDGIKVYKTANIEETILFIEKVFEKLGKDYETFFKFDNQSISVSEYSASLKTRKKDNMTPEIWFHTQLCLIPQITGKIAEVITKTYPSVKELVLAYQDKDEIKSKKLLKDIVYITDKGKERKIGPKISERVYEYFS
jgi:crossover junction endonuclease MUS81